MAAEAPDHHIGDLGRLEEVKNDLLSNIFYFIESIFPMYQNSSVVGRAMATSKEIQGLNLGPGELSK